MRKAKELSRQCVAVQANIRTVTKVNKMMLVLMAGAYFIAIKNTSRVQDEKAFVEAVSIMSATVFLAFASVCYYAHLFMPRSIGVQTGDDAALPRIENASKLFMQMIAARRQCEHVSRIIQSGVEGIERILDKFFFAYFIASSLRNLSNGCIYLLSNSETEKNTLLLPQCLFSAAVLSASAQHLFYPKIREPRTKDFSAQFNGESTYEI